MESPRGGHAQGGGDHAWVQRDLPLLPEGHGSREVGVQPLHRGSRLRQGVCESVRETALGGDRGRGLPGSVQPEAVQKNQLQNFKIK